MPILNMIYWATGWGGRLPSEYQEVVWIWSSWTQYIDAWFIPDNNTKVSLQLSNWDRSVNQYPCIFWARLRWSGSWRWFMLWLDNNGWWWNAMFGWTYNGLSVWFWDGSSHTIEMSQSWIYVDSTLKSSLSSATFTSPSNLVIFALNQNWTVQDNCWCYLYYFKVYDGADLIRDFVPCYRKSDSVIWMYDLVNDIFYTNNWSWTFIKWADVN
jgi:hypothetical protein